MAWVNIFDLLTNPSQLVVEYSGWPVGSSPVWRGKAWAIANEAPYLERVGNKLVMTPPGTMGPISPNEGWRTFRVRVNPPLPFPAPVGVRVLVNGKWWNNPGYPSITVYVGDKFVGDIPDPIEGFPVDVFFPADGTPVEADLRGVVQLDDPTASGIVTGEPWQTADWPEALELEIFIAGNVPFWTGFRNSAEVVDSTDQIAPPPPPPEGLVYQITQGSSGSNYGVRGGHSWVTPGYGSYDAPEGSPALFQLTWATGGNLAMWLNVATPEDVVSAVVSNGSQSIDVLAATAAEGYTTNYNDIYSEPGVMWSAFNTDDGIFDGTTPLTLTITLAE